MARSDQSKDERPDPGEGRPDPDRSDTPEAAHELPIEDHLDLHAFHPREIVAVVADYLEEAARLGFREVRLIHGKGIGFQRVRIRRLLVGHPLVESFADAPAERGHWGATIVRLRETPGRMTPDAASPVDPG